MCLLRCATAPMSKIEKLIDAKSTRPGSLITNWLLAQVAPRVFRLSVLRVVTDPSGPFLALGVFTRFVRKGRDIVLKETRIKVGRQTNYSQERALDPESTTRGDIGKLLVQIHTNKQAADKQIKRRLSKEEGRGLLGKLFIYLFLWLCCLVGLLCQKLERGVHWTLFVYSIFSMPSVHHSLVFMPKNKAWPPTPAHWTLFERQEVPRSKICQ